MTIIRPTGVIDDRIQAYSVEFGTSPFGDRSLLADVSKPTRALIIFDTGLGDQDRLIVSLMVFDKYLAQWAVKVVSTRDLYTIRKMPLIVKVVIETDDVDKIGRTA